MMDYIKKHRGLPFIKEGMKVQCLGKTGVIKGANGSGNLDVLFDGDQHLSSCHPLWEMTYFGEDNEVIKTFKDTK